MQCQEIQLIFYISDRMAEKIKELDQLDVKAEIVSIQEKIHPSSSVEDTCTVKKQEEILPSFTVEETCNV